jgi:hypothetical protein
MIVLYICYPLRDMSKRKGCVATYRKGEKLPQRIINDFKPTECLWIVPGTCNLPHASFRRGASARN